MKHHNNPYQGKQFAEPVAQSASEEVVGLAEPLSNLAQDLRGIGKVTKRLATNALGSVTEHASDYLNEGIEKAKGWEKGVERNVRENKALYIAVVAGIGLAVGAFFLGRRKR